jgi:hypothetical protein
MRLHHALLIFFILLPQILLAEEQKTRIGVSLPSLAPQ